jgi:hypothetical protein
VRLDPLPGEAGVSAWRCRPVVAVLDVPPLPLFPVQSKPASIERPEGGDRLPVKEIVAVQVRADFPFPVEQGDLHALRGQAVLLEEGAQITLPLLAPMVESVRRYLEDKLGEDLKAVRSAMQRLARAYRPQELAHDAYRLYERFRPDIPAGKKGWGAKGDLDLGLIAQMETHKA